MAHTVIKPEKLVATAVGLVQQELILPNLFTKQPLADFKGLKNDTITFRVPGNLPARDYAWRNNRSSPIVFDEYTETSLTVTVGGHAYSGVRLIDEQLDMDFDGWGLLLDAQARAVATKLNRAASAALTGAPYEVILGGAGSNLRGTLIEARRVLNAFGAGPNRILIVGSNFEAELLQDDMIKLASVSGDSVAVAALRNATLGQLYGFRVITDLTIGADDAYAFGDDAFVFVSAAPSAPRGAPACSRISYKGISMRWLSDYDTEYLRDRSVVDTDYGFRSVVDKFRFWDTTLDPDQENNSVDSHFVRGIKLTLGGSSTYPVAGADLHDATGIGV